MSQLMSQNYYQILGVQENCSSLDIRNAFVTLSKTCHPDMNTSDRGLHDKFIKLNEAYRVLSKPSSRIAYDNLLRDYRFHESQTGAQFGNFKTVRTARPMNTNQYPEEEPYTHFRDETIWSMRDKTRVYNRQADSYYGIRGIRRKPNSWIAAGAFVLIGVGIVFHYVAFKYSRFRIEKLNLRNIELHSHLKQARERAKINGTDLQIHRLQHKSEEDMKTKLD